MAIIHKIICAASRRTLCVLIAGVTAVCGVAAQEINPASSQATVRLEAEQQRKEGDLFFADGNVDIHYQNFRLRADHVQYNSKTYEARAHGQVMFEADTQHLTADSADFNV